MQSEVKNEQIQAAETQIASAEDVHLLDILIVFAKRRRFIFRFTLGAAILAVIAVLLLPNRYTAETVVLPPSQNNSMGSTLMAQMSGAGGLAAAAGVGLGSRTPATCMFRSSRVGPWKIPWSSASGSWHGITRRTNRVHALRLKARSR